jgi:hypothetical protein
MGFTQKEKSQQHRNFSSTIHQTANEEHMVGAHVCEHIIRDIKQILG